MSAPSADRLTRVLKIALNSPYEGERQKAVALLSTLLAAQGLRVAQLDTSFAPGDDLDEVRRRAGLPYRFTLSFKSREEGALFRSLLKGLAPLEAGGAELIQGAQGYLLTCVARAASKARAERAYLAARPQLQRGLAAAQERAMQEYRRRRHALFEEAIQALARETLAEDGFDR